MKTYSIIKDLDELQKFLDLLPDTKGSETYYFCLFARKKYAPESGMKADKGSLKRFASKKKDIVKKIKSLEIPIGAYDVDGLEIPQEALAVYLIPNPRCHRKALKALMKEGLDILMEDKEYNLYQNALSHIHKSKSYSFVYDFDVDLGKVPYEDKINVILSLQEEFKKIINTDSLIFNITNGGFHLMVELEKVDKKFKNFQPNFVKLLLPYGLDKESMGDILMPLPGCVQGPSVPKIYQYEKDKLQR